MNVIFRKALIAWVRRNYNLSDLTNAISALVRVLTIIDQLVETDKESNHLLQLKHIQFITAAILDGLNELRDDWNKFDYS